MKVALYDGRQIEFPHLETAKERIEFVIENILEDDELSEYYNPLSDIAINNLDEEDYKTIEDRWLGVKIVGRKDKREHVKSFLGIVASYLLNAKDLSQTSNYRDFYNLAYKEELTAEEKKRFKELKDRVVYADITKQSFSNSSILIRNIEFEGLMKERVEELKREKKNSNSPYTCEFMINDLKTRIEECENIVSEVKKLSIKLSKQIGLVKGQSQILNDIYYSNDRGRVMSIAKKYSSSKTELDWLQYKMDSLIDRYQVATELQQEVIR